jgi:hypothetical protein
MEREMQILLDPSLDPNTEIRDVTTRNETLPRVIESLAKDYTK